MRAGQFGKMPLRCRCQTEQHATLVRVVLDALDETGFRKAVGKLDRGVVTKPQSFGEIPDRDRVPLLVAFDNQKSLMMPRRQAPAFRFILAEFQKAANEKAKLGKRGVVRLGQSGSCQFEYSFQTEPGAEQLNLRLQLRGASGKVWFDDLELIPTP